MKQWNKNNIEEQLKLSKEQTKDNRYDYLCSQFNVINYCLELEKYTNKLNNELNKKNNQISKLYNNNKCYNVGIVGGRNYGRTLNNALLLQKYLIEHKIKNLNINIINDNYKNITDEFKEWLNNKLNNNDGIIDGKLTTGEYIELDLAKHKLDELIKKYEQESVIK